MPTMPRCMAATLRALPNTPVRLTSEMQRWQESLPKRFCKSNAAKAWRPGALALPHPLVAAVRQAQMLSKMIANFTSHMSASGLFDSFLAFQALAAQQARKAQPSQLQDPFHNSSRSVISRARAACCVVFLVFTCQYGQLLTAKRHPCIPRRSAWKVLAKVVQNILKAQRDKLCRRVTSGQAVGQRLPGISTSDHRCQVTANLRWSVGQTLK